MKEVEHYVSKAAEEIETASYSSSGSVVEHHLEAARIWVSLAKLADKREKRERRVGKSPPKLGGGMRDLPQEGEG